MNSAANQYVKKVSAALLEISEKIQINYKNKSLCVCLSGGADSVSLLLSLYDLKDDFGYSLSAAHVNHMLRGDESQRDEDFCKDLCEKLGIYLYKTKIDIRELSKNQKKSIEETARDARYAFFAKIGKEKNIDFFATAHTKNDNAETLYMNIIRGTSVSGLCGIPLINGNVIRPLLGISRQENLAFLAETGSSFVTDSTNSDEAYTRNYIRNSLLLMAEKINPRVIEAADRLSAYARIDEDFFNGVVNNIDENSSDASLHPAILRRLLQKRYEDFTGGKSLMNSHLDSLISLYGSEETKLVSLPDNVISVIKDKKITFHNSKTLNINTDNSIYELKYGENIFADGSVKIVLSKTNCIKEVNFYNNYTYTKLYFDKIIGSIKYRKRETGDKIFCRGVNRSIKKEFIDKKIPLFLRDMIPVFFDDKEVIFVPFVGTCDRVYANDEISDAVCIEVYINDIK